MGETSTYALRNLELKSTDYGNMRTKQYFTWRFPLNIWKWDKYELKYVKQESILLYIDNKLNLYNRHTLEGHIYS